MGDEGEYWNDIKNYRKDQKEKRDRRIWQMIENKLETLSRKYNIEKKTQYQYRINGMLDIYPQNKRYHDIKNNKRGDYNDMIKFVNNFFKH